MTTLGLNQNGSDGKRKYPFPQRVATPTARPSHGPATPRAIRSGRVTSTTSKNLSGTYKKKYGYRTLMNYLQESRFDPSQSEDLWRTPHYPFHANRNGMSLFMDFLTELDFGDEVGWVAYGQWAVPQMKHSDGEVNIDITADPITPDYAVIDTHAAPPSGR